MSGNRLLLAVSGAMGLWLIVQAQPRGQAAAAGERPFAVEPLASPAGANSSAPQLTVEGDRVVLSWIERSGRQAALKFAERTAGGWSDPRVVVSSDHLMVNSADVPSVRPLPDGTLAAHWMEENGPDPEAYDLRVAWSADGRSWSAPVAPNRDKTVSQHGFGSWFPMADGGTGFVWLDGRATHGDEGDMQLRAAMFDKSHKQLSDTVIDSRVCECCPTSVALTADGPIVAFRNRSAGEIRDIYVTRLAAGRWSMPIPVHRDNFKIEGCPVNGPAIAARGRDVVVAWFTAPKDVNRSYLAFSHDGGRTFGVPVRADDVESLGRVVVALKKDGSAVVGWVESSGQTPQFSIRRVQANGTRSAAVVVANQSGTRYPRLALARDEVVLAWTESEQESSRVKTARAAAP
jgi:hypothetical protein